MDAWKVPQSSRSRLDRGFLMDVGPTSAGLAVLTAPSDCANGDPCYTGSDGSERAYWREVQAPQEYPGQLTPEPARENHRGVIDPRPEPTCDTPSDQSPVPHCPDPEQGADRQVLPPPELSWCLLQGSS